MPTYDVKVFGDNERIEQALSLDGLGQPLHVRVVVCRTIELLVFGARLERRHPLADDACL
jgi:hypothetical protein